MIVLGPSQFVGPSSRSGDVDGAPKASVDCARYSASRPTENETRTSTPPSGSTTTRRRRETPTSAGCRRSSTSTTKCCATTACASTTSSPRCPRSAPTATSRTSSRLPGRLVARGNGAIIHRMGLGSWQRGREVIWSNALTALGVPIYLTVHGRGIGEPGAGRWLDSRTFVFNDSVVANEGAFDRSTPCLSGLGIELWLPRTARDGCNSTGHGNIGTTHADMFVMVPDIGVAVLAPHLVDYGFVRYLHRRDIEIIEVPRRGVLGPRRQRRHAGSRQGRDERRRADHRSGTRAPRHRGHPGRLLGKPQIRDRRAPLRDARARHWSPLGGTEDAPENYHVVEIALDDVGGNTKVTLTQSNLAGDVTEADRAGRADYEKNWKLMLDGLKTTAER